MLFSYAVAQAISASPPERVDLTIAQPCNPMAVAQDEVVVCANKKGESPYRLSEPPSPKKKAPKAGLTVAEGVSVAAETESVDVGGFPSNRAMIRLKLKF